MTERQPNTAADRANLLLVEGLLLAGKQKEALDQCVRFCMSPGAGPRDWLTYGCLSADIGDIPTAKAALEKSIRLDPGLVEAYFALGKLLAAAGNPTAAVAQLEKAAELQPDNAELWLTLGISCGLAKQPERSEKCCRRCLELQPDSAQARFHLASALLAQRKFEQAETESEAALRIEPELAAAWNVLARARSALRKLEEAKVAAERAVTLEPRMGHAHFTLGNILDVLGDKKGARDHFREAAELLPTLPRTHMRLGQVLLNLREYASAAESFQRALNIDAGSAETHYLMGESFHRRKMVGRAENCYRAAVALNKNHLRAHYRLATIFGNTNRSDEAAKQFGEILRINPDDEMARHLLAAQLGETTFTAPAGYVKTLFDGFAETFDAKLVEELGYHTPELLYEMVSQVAAPTSNSLDVIDLGCGTGLCGPLFRSMARTLHGVDLSSRMIEKARERKTYDTLETGDIVASLKSRTEAWDLVISTDVFIYVGDLQETFSACAAALRTGGVFAFSVEADDEAETFVLRATGRYAHSSGYIRSLAAATGFTEVERRAVVVRKEKGQDVNGYLFFLRRVTDTA